MGWGSRVTGSRMLLGLCVALLFADIGIVPCLLLNILLMRFFW